MDGIDRLAAKAKREGNSLSAIDGWLAATALQHNLTIVSRNVADFGNTSVPILNPWEAEC
jgi:predicted nucleic acid-binding protein